jgi:putative peptidoglycan lipid II flippase
MNPGHGEIDETMQHLTRGPDRERALETLPTPGTHSREHHHGHGSNSGLHLVRAIGAVAVVGCAVKVAALVQELVVVHEFGVGPALDAVAVAVVVPMLLVNLIGASTAEALVPVHTSTAAHDGAAAAAALERRVVRASALIMCAAALVVAASASWVIRVVAPGFDDRTTATAARLLIVSSLVVPLAGLTAILGRVVNLHGRYLMVSLSAAAIPASVVVGVIGFGRRFGVEALMVATVAGYAMQFAVVSAMLRRCRDSRRPGPSAPPDATAAVATGGEQGVSRLRLQELRRIAIPLACVALLGGSAPVVDDAFASRLGPGSVASLHLGNRLLSLLVSVIGLAVGTVLAPQFARLAAALDIRGLRATARRAVLTIVAVAFPVAIVLGLVSTPIVRLAFDRGAFESSAIGTVARIQAISLLQLAPYLVTTVLIRVLAAINATRRLMPLNFTLDAVLAEWIGLRGIVLSSTIVAMITATMLWRETIAAIDKLPGRSGG